MKQAKITFIRRMEFAALAGVTVRALHHYDRLALLKPVRRTEAGTELCRRHCDLARLEQIVLLKLLGFSLKQIGELLDDNSELVDTLDDNDLPLAQSGVARSGDPGNAGNGTCPCWSLQTGLENLYQNHQGDRNEQR